MTEYTNGIIPLERGEAAIIAGVGGSGKTGLLEAIYQSEVDRKKRNVVMIHSSSRLFEASPSLAIIDFEYSDLYGEEKEAFKRIEKERGEKSLSSEFSAILRLILEFGLLPPGSLLIIDSLEYGMDGEVLTKALRVLSRILDKGNLTLVATVSTMMGLRAVETVLGYSHLYLMQKGEKGEMELKDTTEESEEAYRALLRMVENL